MPRNSLTPVYETGPGGRRIEEPIYTGDYWMRAPEAIDAWRESLMKYKGYTLEQATAEYPYDPTYIPPSDEYGKSIPYNERHKHEFIGADANEAPIMRPIANYLRKF